VEVLNKSNSSMIFDQYSRYSAVSFVVNGVSKKGQRILDVGSGPYCLLGQFLPDFVITYLDPLLEGLDQPESNIITTSFFNIDLNSDEFKTDDIVSVDTFEHIRPELRDEFLSRCSQLANETIVLAFPCGDAEDSRDVDNEVNNQYFSVFGTDYSWLNEHKMYGLPSTRDTILKLEGMGWHVRTYGHGRTKWLKELLPIVVLMNEFPDMKPAIERISSRFNSRFAPFDFGSSAYRTILVASKKPSPVLEFEEADEEKLKEDWENFKNELILEFVRELKDSVLDNVKHIMLEVQRLNGLLHEQGTWGQTLTKEVEVRDEEIIRLRGLLEEQTSWALDLKRQIEIRDIEIRRLQNANQ